MIFIKNYKIKSNRKISNEEDNLVLAIIMAVVIFIAIKGIIFLFSKSYIQIIITILILTLDKGSYESVLKKKIDDSFNLLLTKIKVIWVVFYGCIRFSIEFKGEFENFILQRFHFDQVDPLGLLELFSEVLFVFSSLLLCILAFYLIKLLMYIVYSIWNFLNKTQLTR